MKLKKAIMDIKMNIQYVWNNAKVIQNRDPNEYRLDKCNALIKYCEYGNSNSNSKLGWEINHVIPFEKGGTDNLSNLQVLQRKNNVAIGNRELCCANRANDNYSDNMKVHLSDIL